MAKNMSSEELAMRTFWITIAGVVAYVATVFIYVF